MNRLDDNARFFVLVCNNLAHAEMLQLSHQVTTNIWGELYDKLLRRAIWYSDLTQELG